jgi:hypothetical protein
MKIVGCDLHTGGLAHPFASLINFRGPVLVAVCATGRGF